MPRPSQLLYPPKPSVTPRPAATLLLLRDSADGLQVLMTRRSAKASFVPGTHVFPGGGIEPQDQDLRHCASRHAAQSDEQQLAAIAAIRETFEELGILLAQHPDGRWPGAATLAALKRDAPLLAQLHAHDLQLAAANAFAMCRWTTGPRWPKRYDTLFLVAEAPPAQVAVADQTEQFEPVWITPATALALHEKGEFDMIYPTIQTLEYLTQHDRTSQVLAACADQELLWERSSRGGLVDGKERRFMNHEQPYGELLLVNPGDVAPLPELRWQSERPVALLKNVQRLTAPNPGIMTGPGTNSYIVGDAGTGHIVIDPGPDDAPHIQRLYEAAGGDIRAIVCTHSHPDHFPGARPLQALCASRPPILGLPSAPTAEAHSRFRPDRALADDERLVLAAGDGAATHTLRTIHTPGHAANHLCLLLEEDGLLFSGDHILNGSTTVINPPDGHMGDYLASLDKLDAACEATGTDFILPAHGHVLARARAVIAWFKAHRLEREAKVLAAMRAQPQGDLDDWLPAVYGDVPETVWPVARRSLLAHVQHIRETGAR